MTHFNDLTPAEAERLALLMEECAEVQQVIGKILRHGYESCHPNGGLDNRDLLQKELGDVHFAINLMCEAQDVFHAVIENHENEKAVRIVKYLHHQDEGPATQTLSDEGRKLIRRFERLRLSPYHDAVGYPTIGYGHLLSREKWADLSQWPDITEEQADYLLRQDVHRFERAVSRLVSVPLSQGQFDALVSFTFNLGAGALQDSTLRRVLNEGHYYQIPHELRRWIYAGGVKLYGLKLRREAEAIAGRPWQSP